MTCKHETLMFGSGDYYVFCQECGDRWIKGRLGRQEYGPCTNGKMIGGDPTACVPGFADSRFRVPDRDVSEER